jgi:hypothetical protein
MISLAIVTKRLAILFGIRALFHFLDGALLAAFR